MNIRIKPKQKGWINWKVSGVMRAVENIFNQYVLLHKIYYNSFEMEINRQQSNNQEQRLSQRNKFNFTEPRQPHIFFNSDFDSGNMSRVVKTAYDHYSIWTACDAQGTDNQGYPKSWFYFEVGGFSNRKVTFSIHRVHFLFAMSKRHQMYRPVYRIRYQNGQISQWDRLPYPVNSLALNNDDQLVLKFEFLFNKLIGSVEFAFTYPYSYQQCRTDILALNQQYQKDREIFFGHYILNKSYEGRIIDFVVISSHEGKEGFEVTKGTPFSDQKIVKFRNNKPIIFISARVHPIQTPSSYTMTGVLKFLLDKKDMRAHLLRKYFVFVLVPMLNPDGVSRGHCRMDALNQNLNRYYNTPDPEKQPSCYAIKKLCEHYSKDKRLFMYLDLHAHPAFKGNFIFGNAIYEFIEQVQSQIFPKILSQNCINFDFDQCIFSRKHMKAKDRNQDFSKEGCGRVVFYKEFGLVHSYTLECGYHQNTVDNTLQEQQNTTQKYVVKYRINDKGQKIYQGIEKSFDEQKLQKYLEDLASRDDPKLLQYDIFGHTRVALDDNNDDYYKRQLPTYSQQTFYNLGRNILISILDIWNKNPFTRVTDMNTDRKEIAERQAKLDRFRKEQAGIKSKQKKIVQLIEEQFYAEWHRRNIFNPSMTQNQPQRDKKRNHTLQVQRLGLFKHAKSQKHENPGMKVEQTRQTKTTNINSDKCIEVEPNSQAKIQSSCQTDKACSSQINSQNRMYYSRNFKVGRGKQTNSANHQKEGGGGRAPSINKQMLASHLKATLENELVRGQKHEGFSLSSKVIKNAGINLNMRVRNVVISGIGGVLAAKK